jgi:para-aminobenzoate synthetase component 1
LAQRLTADATVDSATLYLRLRQANPAPLAGFYDGGDFQVLSSSPEGFLHVRDGVVETRPIKGTVARTGDPTIDRTATDLLLASEKDHAENVMIVDLMRNDLSRVCEDDSVVVTQLCAVEHYAFVQHLVSVVRGRLRPGVSAIDLLAACFPGGSVTGAPKIEAMRTIAHLEPTRRGPYCGSLGYVSVGGDAEFNILIRTLTATGDRWQIPVGGGITAQSNSVDEERETWVKAEGMLRAIPGGIMP